MNKKMIEQNKKTPMTDREFNKSFAFSVLSIVLCLIGLVGTTLAWYTANEEVGVSDINISASQASEYNTFTTVFEHTDRYLYRVGNGNAVALKYLFKIDEDAPGPGDVDITKLGVSFEAVDPQSSIYSKVENNNITFTKNTSDWKESTIRFAGEGPVKVTIREGGGTPYTLNLEIVSGTNFTTGTAASAISSSGTTRILLNDFTLATSSSIITFQNAKLFGNGFKLDLTNGYTKDHGILQFINATVDNVVIIGPVFTTYEGTYRNEFFASTIVCSNTIISNCRITGASSPLRTKGDTEIYDTVLSGGIFANMHLFVGRVIANNLTTVNTQNGLGICFQNEAPESCTLTINGELIQHNFIADNATTSNTYANALKNTMFSSTYSKYQFSSGNRKYVNTGIISMSPNVGAANIIDNRADKKNYSGNAASIAGYSGYVYTMENTDSSLLETSYTEPDYIPSTQLPYEPVFSWSLGSQTVPEGGDTHCYKDDTTGFINIQFLSGDTFTLDAAELATVLKYGAREITPSITCAEQNGTSIPVNNGEITFDTAGRYDIVYAYSDDVIYGKDATVTGTVATYSKTVTVIVNIKLSEHNAVITCTTNSESMIWGKSGTTNDPDYIPAAPIFKGMTIKDYDDDGNEYTVVDGSSQSTFLSNIDSVTADEDNKTGFTINLKDGCTIYVKCGAPYNSGTLEFKKYNNTFYMCGSKAANNPTNMTWNVTLYTYTGRNGVAVSYTTKRTFTGSSSDSNSYTLTNLDGSSSGGGGGTCITGDTLITLANGTKKAVKDLTSGEELLVWNFETGKYDSAPIVFVDSDGYADYEVIHVCFSDGSEVKVVYEHGFFDYDMGKYVYINASTLNDYIGHRFVKQSNIASNNYKTVTLESVYTTTSKEKVYSPVTFRHLCYFTNGVLSMPGGISGLFNIFEVDTETMTYDHVKMQHDIQQYGLLTVNDYDGMITQEAFDAFNGAWLGIAVGKGLLTWGEIAYLAERYIPLMT